MRIDVVDSLRLYARVLQRQPHGARCTLAARRRFGHMVSIGGLAVPCHLSQDGSAPPLRVATNVPSCLETVTPKVRPPGLVELARLPGGMANDAPPYLRDGNPKPFIPLFPDVHPAFGRLISKTFRREVDSRFPTDEAKKEDATGFVELIRITPD